ncbi:hypothetical protein CBP36_19470 (plasmid) [Acidovorax carolinensis]|jgi:hypothetical protein|uniref:Uncharacterized protein n=1 Tax=Acidovorax carolinensis TaxID=553814 RepID=A0A240UJE7_9BURK|nr:hypothetical protein [Acidovorax carolinensis]ART57087.1 hypothetical protein CBP35_19420 [Acidovorax carolinensis]ART61149.1 hypothetical protein CBP36_19470 [Acidovorax carolinensis]
MPQTIDAIMTLQPESSGGPDAVSSTLYIVPACTDMSGQCRIVGFRGITSSARDCYETNPGLWVEAGLMNSRGELVCLSDEFAEFRQELLDSQPLMASLQFSMRSGAARTPVPALGPLP